MKDCDGACAKGDQVEGYDIITQTGTNVAGSTCMHAYCMPAIYSGRRVSISILNRASRLSSDQASARRELLLPVQCGTVIRSQISPSQETACISV